MKDPVFKIADNVEFYGVLGKVISIEMCPNDSYLYKVGYCVDGDYKIVTLYDFELQTVSINQIGFKKE